MSLTSDPSANAPLERLPIRILGAGRLGPQLAIALGAAGFPDIRVWNPRPLSAAREALFLAGIAQLDLPPERAPQLHAGVPLEPLLPDGPALYFLTAPDAALEPLAETLAQSLLSAHPSSHWLPSLAFHCSGACPLSVLEPLRQVGLECAGLHPLQSFSGVPDPERFRGIFCALEGSVAGVARAEALTRRLGGIPLVLKSGGRLAYHASAVVASNLLVSLLDLAVELLGEATSADAQTRLQVLLPLVEGTVRNLRSQGLPAALTGPIARGDAAVVARHQAYLSGGGGPTLLAQVYPLLSQQALTLAQAQGLAQEKVAEVQLVLTEGSGNPSSSRRQG